MSHTNSHCTDKRHRDPDNLIASAKPYLDALKKYGVIEGDSVWNISYIVARWYWEGEPGFTLILQPLVRMSIGSPLTRKTGRTSDEQRQDRAHLPLSLCLEETLATDDSRHPRRDRDQQHKHRFLLAEEASSRWDHRLRGREEPHNQDKESTVSNLSDIITAISQPPEEIKRLPEVAGGHSYVDWQQAYARMDKATEGGGWDYKIQRYSTEGGYGVVHLSLRIWDSQGEIAESEEVAACPHERAGPTLRGRHTSSREAGDVPLGLRPRSMARLRACERDDARQHGDAVLHSPRGLRQEVRQEREPLPLR